MSKTKRLFEAHESNAPWRKWGPYLSEQHWGTVRKDYSDKAVSGIFFHMTRFARGYIEGERTGLQISVMINNCCAGHWHYETRSIQS